MEAAIETLVCSSDNMYSGVMLDSYQVVVKRNNLALFSARRLFELIQFFFLSTPIILFFFFLIDPPPTEISPLPLHAALPISGPRARGRPGPRRGVAGEQAAQHPRRRGRPRLCRRPVAAPVAGLGHCGSAARHPLRNA